MRVLGAFVVGVVTAVAAMFLAVEPTNWM